VCVPQYIYIPRRARGTAKPGMFRCVSGSPIGQRRMLGRSSINLTGTDAASGPRFIQTLPIDHQSRGGLLITAEPPSPKRKRCDGVWRRHYDAADRAPQPSGGCSQSSLCVGRSQLGGASETSASRRSSRSPSPSANNRYLRIPADHGPVITTIPAQRTDEADGRERTGQSGGCLARLLALNRVGVPSSWNQASR
jgi:hypothetical protein